uniref:Cyclic AMP-responsive element-binding protein 3-like protein 3 n=1 Tax=Callorhinchus milii TaxID=7868 RepID=V9KRN9_CALMI
MCELVRKSLQSSEEEEGLQMALSDDLNNNELMDLLFQTEPLSDQEFSDGTKFMEDWGLCDQDMLNDHDTEDFLNSIIGSFEDESPAILSWSPVGSDSGISEDNNHFVQADSLSGSDAALSDSPSCYDVIVSDHNYSLVQDSQQNADCLYSVKTETPTTETDISIDLDWEPEFLTENSQVVPTKNSTDLVSLTIEDLQQYSKLNPYQFDELLLNDEERRLLAKEGLSIPTNLPLTKSEERILKRIRRKIRNKQSAQESRRRKKDYIDGLESRVVACTVQNQELQRKVQHLEKQNISLVEQLRRLQALIKQASSKTANTSTCIMVFLLSFTLIIFPSINPFGGKLVPKEESYSVLSRTLLDTESSQVRIIPNDYNADLDINPETIEEKLALGQEVPESILSGGQNSTPETANLAKTASAATLSSNFSSDTDGVVKAPIQDDVSLERMASINEKVGFGASATVVNKPNWTEHSTTVIIKTHPRSDEM